MATAQSACFAVSVFHEPKQIVLSLPQYTGIDTVEIILITAGLILQSGDFPSEVAPLRSQGQQQFVACADEGRGFPAANDHVGTAVFRRKQVAPYRIIFRRIDDSQQRCQGRDNVGMVTHAFVHR